MTIAIVLSVSCVSLAATIVEQDWLLARRLILLDPDALIKHPDLVVYAMQRGRRTFLAHCASCHGSEGKGDAGTGIPDLTDKDYLYGEGRVSEIEDIVRHGIRAGDRRGRNFAYMPAYAREKPYAAEPIPPLTPHETQDVVQMLLNFTGKSVDARAAARGRAIFLGKGGCYDCHGGDAQGDPAIGAPNLTDAIWLYGDGSARAITASIEQGRNGYSPAYKDVLTAEETRAVAVFVAAFARPSGLPANGT